MNIQKKVRLELIVTLFILLIIFSALIPLTLFFYKQSPHFFSIDGMKINDEEINYCLDSVTQDQNIIFISGWAFKKGEDISLYNCHIAFENKETGEYFYVPTEMVERKDVTEAYDGKNYDRSGFKSIFPNKKFKSNFKYEICILYKNNDNNTLIKTGQYIQ